MRLIFKDEGKAKKVLILPYKLGKYNLRKAINFKINFSTQQLSEP